MSQRPFIEIFRMPTGQIATAYRPDRGHDPLLIGIALASATRVVAASLLKELKLGEEHREPLIRAIVETYLRDLKMGDMGEAESTHLEETP